MVFAGVFVLLAVALVGVKARESGQQSPLFWIDIAFVSIVTLIAVPVAFKHSRRRLMFWIALLTMAGTQVGIVLLVIPSNTHVPAVWGGLVTYGEFVAISGVLLRLGFR
jgi:hypothetical protein